MPQRVEFTNTVLDRPGADSGFMTMIFFSNEATFHVSGKVNLHNVRIPDRDLIAFRELIIVAIESNPENMPQNIWQDMFIVLIRSLL